MHFRIFQWNRKMSLVSLSESYSNTKRLVQSLFPARPSCVWQEKADAPPLSQSLSSAGLLVLPSPPCWPCQPSRPPACLIDVALTQAGCWPTLSLAHLVIRKEVRDMLKRYRAQPCLAGGAEETGQQTHGRDGPKDVQRLTKRRSEQTERQDAWKRPTNGCMEDTDRQTLRDGPKDARRRLTDGRLEETGKQRPGDRPTDAWKRPTDRCLEADAQRQTNRRM